jgi:thioesterase domain-containing protein
MVPIKHEGDRPPFFCVHGADGQVIGFYNLAKRLGSEQPFYGIQSVGWDGSAPFTNTADMVAHYISEIRKIQPYGPYYLGGISFGGRIAVYMAITLKQAGEEVALLAILDSYNLIGQRYVSLRQWLERIGWPQGHGRVTRWLERNGAPRVIGLTWLALRYVWFRTYRAYCETYVRGRGLFLTLAYQWYRVMGKSIPLPLCRPDRCNVAMRHEHRHMPPYEGDAVYFQAETNNFSMQNEDGPELWSQIIKGKLNIIPVTGTHLEIVKEPHVKLLAEKLALELARARKKYQTKPDNLMSAVGQKRTSG